MSYVQITVNALSPLALSDVLGLETTAPEATFTRISANGGETVVIRCTGPTWDRLRPQLRKLSQRRVPALDGTGAIIPGHTAPLMTYSQAWVPGDRPRLTQLEGSIEAATDSSLTVRGTNLVPGTKAALVLYRERVLPSGFAPAGSTPLYNQPEAVLTFTAVPKGPVGNQIGILIGAAAGAGSVTTEEYGDGRILIYVVPAASTNTATAIAAQVNGDTSASRFVTATANVGAALIPAFTGHGPISGPNVTNVQPYQFLTGGDGAGIAFADLLVSGTDPANALHIQAQRSGNQSNTISVTLLVSQLANSVVVTDTDIVVSRTAATVAIGTLATAINASADAADLVHATAIGSGSLGAVSKTYLAGGAGEMLRAQIGGVEATVSEQSDTSMVLSVSGGDLAAAGVLAGEVAQVNVLVDYQRLSASVVVAATPVGP